MHDRSRVKSCMTEGVTGRREHRYRFLPLRMESWRDPQNAPLTAQYAVPRASHHSEHAHPKLTDIERTPLTVTMEASSNHGSRPGAALMKQTSKYVGLDVHQATTLA